MKSFTERNPLWIGLIAVAVVVGGTAAAVLLNAGFFADRYRVDAVFADTAGLRTGDLVRVAGVPAGAVASIAEQDGEVVVALDVDRGVELPADTRAEVVVETLLGSKHVRLVAGSDWGELLEDGAEITDTRTPTEILDLQNVGTPLLEDTDAAAISDLLGKIDRISEGQRGNVEEIVDGLNRLTTVINDRRTEASRLIDSARTVSATLAERDEDLLAAVDDLGIVVDALARRRVELAGLLAQTSATASTTADLVAENRPELDLILDELHLDLEIVGARQGELAATLSGLANAIDGFSSIGYSGPDEFPNQWANMYTQLLGPIGPDAVFGSCGLLDDAFDVLLGDDPIADCEARTGPLPSAEGSGGGSDGPLVGGPTPDPLDALFGPLAGGPR